MIRRRSQLLKNNKFSVILWLGVCFLLVLTSFERGLSFQQSSNSRDECGFEDVLGIRLAEALGCGLSNSAGTVGEDSGVRFEINVGQADSSYSFVASGRAQAILLSGSEAVFHLKATKSAEPRTVHAALMGARPGAEAKAEGPLSGRVNYLIGNDPRRWHTDVPTFGRVRFTNVYPGIDVAYHGNRGDLETDFIVQPGADPQAIRIHFEGADQVGLAKDFSLETRAGARTLRWKKPTLYQTADSGALKAVEGNFKLGKDGVLGFEVGVYDTSKPLVIDPVLTYSTYFGTSATDGAARVVADASGNSYIVGSSAAVQFPVTTGTFFNSVNGKQGTVLIAKVAADGKSMVYETHIGGSNGDLGWGIAIDSAGNVYLTGLTASSDFPVVPSSNNLTSKNPSDPANCFISKLNSAGNALVYSMVMGGTSLDGCSSIGVDSSGNAYVVGVTDSSDLPLVNAIQTTFPAPSFGSASDCIFAAKLNPDGVKLLYSTYFGGSGHNIPTSLAVDTSGNSYFTGFTTSFSFPVSQGALQTSLGGSGGQNYSIFSTGDAFAVKLNSAGQKVYATYLGGSKDDIGVGIAIDSKGNAYIGGATLSADFPVQNAFQASYHGAGGDTFANGGDGFVTELDPTGSKILFSSYLGGSADDRVLGIAVDPNSNIYLTGHTISLDFPTAGQAPQSAYAGDNSTVFRTGDAFLAEVDGSSHMITFSTYLGGSGGDWAGGVAIDGAGGVIIAGGTSSANFPTSTGSYQAKYGGTDPGFANTPVGDAFIAKYGGAVSPVSIAGVANAASYVGGAIAPGEALFIAGTSIGPPALAGAAFDSKGNISSLIAGTQFLFNGVAAPIVYVSAKQSSVIVPYEVASASTAQIVAVYNGAVSVPITVPVVAALPGIFSANSSGTGLGAILNQDGSYNSAGNPAARGSVVVLFVTGEGQTTPPGVDGRVTGSPISPAAPVTVTFGSIPATSYPFVGEAPGLVAGVLQINVTVPSSAPTGSVPITVAVGSTTSQAGLTVAVQ
jgi:uncharacterized protein (TIGR03437 family)